MNCTQSIIVTGMSGSGKSTALAAFEDAGYYCIDNIPITLFSTFFKMPIRMSSEISGVVFGMDLRDYDFIKQYSQVFESLKKKKIEIRIYFFEADDSVLIRRFSQTRRLHPLSQSNSLTEGIIEERKKLAAIRNIADKIINTSQTNVHELKSMVFKIAHANSDIAETRINVMSFGFKHGIPLDADLLIDVRFLANPYFIPELKDLSGETEAVRDFVLNRDETRLFLEKYIDLLDYLIPLYKKEGKAYLNVAVGCTGGRHRSVAVACEIYKHISNTTPRSHLIHRDKDR